MSLSASEPFRLGQRSARQDPGAGRIEDSQTVEAGGPAVAAGTAPRWRRAAAIDDAALNRQARLRARTRRVAAAGALILGDIATYAGAYAVLSPFIDGAGGLHRILALIALCMIALYGSARLYPGYRLHHYERLRRRAMATLTAAPVAGLGAALVLGQWRPIALAAGFPIIALCVQPVVYHAVRRLLRNAGCWAEDAVIIATANTAALVKAYFDKNWQYGIRPMPVGTGHGSGRVRPAAGGLAEIALIAGGTIPPRDELAKMRRIYREIILLADTPNMVISGLRPADLNGQIGMRLALSDPADGSGVTRRLLDIAIAAPAAIFLAPLMLIAAAAIFVIDPGPVLYRQAREGLFGRTIHVLKLRTMYRDAEQRLGALLAQDPSAQAEWSAHFKLKDDPRILPVVGKFLRSTSLDEVPQLLNVIAGDMRIVGPRPFPGYHLSAMEPGFRTKRCSVTPGLTGLWQISERSDAGIELQQQLDEFYIDNRSLWFDWHIIFSTIPAVFKRGGA